MKPDRQPDEPGLFAELAPRPSLRMSWKRIRVICQSNLWKHFGNFEITGRLTLIASAVSNLLDALGSTLGDTLYRGSSLWTRLAGNTTTVRQYLSQTGTGSASAAPAWNQVTDTDLSLSNVTTNDVSTTKHGFAPKAPNDATKYLDGTGAYSVPAGSGSGISQLTGDVTAGPGSGSQAATIPNGTVTYAKMQATAAASVLLGRGAGSGAGAIQEIALGSGLSMSGTTLSASGGGGGGGTPPTIVQSAISNALSTSITLGAAPTAGNLLVCISQPNGGSAGSGWTVLSSNASGTYFGLITYKVAGAGESATQTPIASSSSGNVMMVWELSGQNATLPFVTALAAFAGAATSGASALLPAPTNSICLFGLSLETSAVSFSTVHNFTQDGTVGPSGGSGKAGIMGHATAANQAYYVLYSLSGSSNSRPSYVVVTA